MKKQRKRKVVPDSILLKRSREKVRKLLGRIRDLEIELRASNAGNHWTWKERSIEAERLIMTTEKALAAARAELKAEAKRKGSAAYTFTPGMRAASLDAPEWKLS